MQLYKDLDIGSAKPEPEILSAVPHNLLSYVSPEENYDVSRYLEDAYGEVRR